MQTYKTLNNGIRIVEYSDAIAETVADMWNKSNESWGGGSGVRTAQQIISEHSSFARFNVYIAMDGDDAVGYCSLTRSYFDTNTLYIHLLGVRPDYQGKKVGKALVLQCVERTIELGFPRLDIHTWAGNTQAVPLYKKCGYLWEDRENSTYLMNFIPAIVGMGLFAEFFKKADWYADSTRTIEIEPDEAKHNKFGLFGYSWEKDNETLAIGFERSGKRIRFIETNDYKIELMADSHEPAFGMHYNCTFTVENKTGKNLYIKITGKNDGNITFDYRVNTAVDSKQTFSGRFYVAPISQPQDSWRMHPCVLADVEINGETVEFGLGINSKVPVQLSLHQQRQVTRVGAAYDCYFNIKSALSEDALVSFSIPQNELNRFENASYTTQILADARTSIKTNSVALRHGHVEMPVKFSVSFATATPAFQFEYPLHIVNQGISHVFAYEDEKVYCIVNGPWRIELDKNDNEANTYNISGGEGINFEPPKLGKPYANEFDAAKPTVKMFEHGNTMVMEAEFVSEKFRGIVLTIIYTLSAAGAITRNYRIKNTSTNEQPLMLLDPQWLPMGVSTIFNYDGKIITNSDGKNNSDALYGFSDIEPNKFNENWLFEPHPHHPFGVCWHPSYKPSFKYGSGAGFEINCGNIAPGQTFETHPIEFMFGVFNNFNAFRNYAMNQYNRTPALPENIMQPRLNGHNPFIMKNTAMLEILNNRSVTREGRINVSSNGITEPQHQSNPGETVVPANVFDLPLCKPASDVGLINIELDLVDYYKPYQRALFFPGNNSVTTHESDGVFTVSNGRLTFKVSPAWSNALFSMVSHATEGDNEWLFSRYPVHEPYAWDSPFIGGLHSKFSNMRNSMLLKEHVTANFTEMTDCFGNKWQGIRTVLTINEFDANKNATCESYYLTMPGLPVLCHFIKFVNNTGHFRNDKITTSAVFESGGKLTDLAAEFTNKNNINYHMRFGVNDDEFMFDRLLKLRSQRAESLYLYKDDREMEVYGDNKIVGFYANTYMHAEHGGTLTGKPLFLITTNTELTLDALEDLRRVQF